MQQLIDGYAKFRSKVFPQHSELFEKLSTGQQPQALFICCSDSRVMPEMIMQCEPGVLFPIRNAGNLVPVPGEASSGVAATVEYAIRVLNVADVIICGHSDCGAMKGMLHMEQLESLPVVKAWLENAGASSRGRLASVKDAEALPFQEKLALLAELNVIAQVENLKAHPAVYEAMRRGTLKVHGWMYDIGSGGIRRFDTEKGSFVALLPEDQPVIEAGVRDERKIA
ncbi:MAG: carbonic anhydrase [Edaphobacter sp.]|uniref:carbonic anhydrase n=1 Tax=Edaphobacter sp. TaxID=1934404 RepID=UPI00239ECB70|nr:carbonic anhydrase [Edaphobacter sp.]MDE1177224.1 carbonic anhydrase [Edaphobacter sp.]